MFFVVRSTLHTHACSLHVNNMTIATSNEYDLFGLRHKGNNYVSRQFEEAEIKKKIIFRKMFNKTFASFKSSNNNGISERKLFMMRRKIARKITAIHTNLCTESVFSSQNIGAVDLFLSHLNIPEDSHIWNNKSFLNESKCYLCTMHTSVIIERFKSKFTFSWIRHILFV